MTGEESITNVRIRALLVDLCVVTGAVILDKDFGNLTIEGQDTELITGEIIHTIGKGFHG